MRRYFLYILIVFPCLLWSQNQPTVLEKLQAGETIRLEWVHQQYLPDSGSVVGDYPLFPDQMKEGEGESFIGLKLEMDNCSTKDCPIKMWVEYVSTVEFPERPTYNPKANVYLPNTPPSAMLFPKIADTRYVDKTLRKPAFSLGDMGKTPAIVEVQTGMQDSSWINKNVDKSTLPKSFNQYYLERFLNKLWKAKWTQKAHYHRLEVFELFDKVSVNFFKPIHPPKRTVITGKIHFPRVEKVWIAGLLEGSHGGTFGQGILTLDETGLFNLTTLLTHPKVFNLLHELNSLVLYVEPGDSIHIEIDANAFYRKTQFSGNQAIANQFLLDFYHEMRGDSIMTGLDKNLLQKTQLVFLKEIQQKEKQELVYINQRKKDLSPEFTNHFDRFIRLYYAQQLWYNAVWFYLKKDAFISPEYAQYAQSLRKYFFRLPDAKNYDGDIEQYVSFQSILLAGTYTSKLFSFRGIKNYELAKLILSTKNTFRLGRILLSFNQGRIENSRLDAIYEELKIVCQDEKDLIELEDFKNLNLQLPPMNGITFLIAGRKAPNWAFENKAGKMVKSTDFKGDYFLLHIGSQENLAVAREDLQTIKNELKADIKTISLVQKEGKENEEKLFEEDIIFVSPTEMQILRDSFSIGNQGNNYYLIDSAGMVAASPFDLNSFHKLKSAIATLPKKEAKFSWQPSSIFWQNLGIIALILLLLSGIYIQRKRTLAKREQQRRQLLELELKGIRAQMNPHFLFNALSSIQNLIRKREEVKADRYLTQFAGLVRKILRNSEQEFITLEEEMAAIRQYCSLEALRTPFEFEITIDDKIDGFNTYIPSMLMQPIVENAILHGLMPKKGAKHLWINIEPHAEGLACEVKDDGIGINRAKTQKQAHKAHQKSFGMALIQQRLALLRKMDSNELVTIQDRSELNPVTTGTIVKLIIPIEA